MLMGIVIHSLGPAIEKDLWLRDLELSRLEEGKIRRRLSLDPSLALPGPYKVR